MERGIVVGSVLVVISVLLSIALNTHAGCRVVPILETQTAPGLSIVSSEGDAGTNRKPPSNNEPVYNDAAERLMPSLRLPDAKR